MFHFGAGNNSIREDMITVNRDEYNCLTELCNVAGVKTGMPVQKSDLQIENGFKFEKESFFKLRRSILSGLANKKLITLENDNNNPPDRTFEYNDKILFDIIKRFDSFRKGVEKQFQTDAKVKEPMFDINSTGYEKLSLGQICMADDFLDYVTTSFNGEKYEEIPSCIKNIFEKNFNGDINGFDIGEFENTCISKLLKLGNTGGKWHQNSTIFKEDLRLNEKLKMLDFYYKELPKLTNNRISPRLRLAFVFSLHIGWCSEYTRDIIKQKQMDGKFENVCCALDALQTYNSSQLNCDNLVNDLKSVLNFMREQGIIVYNDNIFGDLDLNINDKNYVWASLKYFFTWFITFCSGNFKVKNYMKAERFVSYLKNYHLTLNLKSDYFINEKMSLFDAISRMRDHILRRRPDKIELEKIMESHPERGPIFKDYHYYELIDKNDHKYIPLDDQKIIEANKKLRRY